MGALELLNWARAQIGVKESPAGSNNVPYNTAYYGREIHNAAYHWCVVFVWAGMSSTHQERAFYGGGKTASCSVLAYWAQQNGYTVKPADMRPGDWVIFDWDKNGNPDHIGIVEEATATKLTTIEGNVGDAVCRMDRQSKRGNIYMVIRPPYVQTTSTSIKARLQALRDELDNIIKEV